MWLTKGYQIVIIQWCMLAFATPFVLMRLYVQFRLLSKPYREIFILTAWFCSIAWVSCNSVLNDLDWYNLSVDYSLKSPEYMTRILKVLFAGRFFNMPGLYCVKAAFLCFYKDLTPKRLFPKTYYTIMAAWVSIVVGFLYATMMPFFECRPFTLEFNWPMAMSCGGRGDLQIGTWSAHIITDVIVYGIPFAIMRNLNTLSGRQKLRAYVMFAIGFANVFSAFWLMVFYVGGENIKPKLLAAVAFFVPFQLSTALIVICPPQARRLLFVGIKAEDVRPELKGLPEAHEALARDLEAQRIAEQNDNASVDGKPTCKETQTQTVMVDDGNEMSDSEKKSSV